MNPAQMLREPVECGVPCATTEALAHDNARLRTEIGILRRDLERLTADNKALAARNGVLAGMIHAAQANVALTGAARPV